MRATATASSSAGGSARQANRLLLSPAVTARTHAHALGLTAVSTEQLRTALRGLHRQTLACPLTVVGLTAHGLQDVAGPLLGHLRGLEAGGVRAVVVAVLADRQEMEQERERARYG